MCFALYDTVKSNPFFKATLRNPSQLKISSFHGVRDVANFLKRNISFKWATNSTSNKGDQERSLECPPQKTPILNQLFFLLEGN